jgi:type III pantothenate kinase
MTAIAGQEERGDVVVVDIGNARLKWARVAAGRLAPGGAVIHVRALDAALRTLAAALPERPERIVVANVAGAHTATRLQALTRERYGLEPEFVAAEAETLGVRCAYRDPSRLGPDRWAAIVAAHAAAAAAEPARPACLINAGTAFTFDAIDAGGRHLGGLILPGPRIAADALRRNTKRIGETVPPARVPAGLDVLGKSTDEAVGHGALLGPAAAFDRAVGAVERALGARPIVYLAGGDAALLAGWLETKTVQRADLVLEGLALIASRKPVRPARQAAE